MPLTFNSGVSGTEEGIALDALVNNTIAVDDVDTAIGVTQATVGGVRQVSVTWSDLTVYLDNEAYPLVAGSVVLNTTDIINPTTYYVYAHLVGGVLTVTRSLTSPEDSLTEYSYAWLAIPRIQSVLGVANIFYVRRAYCPVNYLLHRIGEFDFQVTPEWVDGGGITINATSGVVDMEELEVRRMRYETELDAVTAGILMYEDEATSSLNLETITTYSDGSAIGSGKYHKILFGRLSSPFSTIPYIIVRQGKPGTEYTTLDEARIDAEDQAATSFPVQYKGVVLPVAYIIMKKGDASDLTTIDLRATGVIGGGGGGGVPITDHGSLTGLGDDDHTQYLLADGSRNLAGNLGVDALVTIDGVDISVHATTANAHHNPITLDANADTLLSLSTQAVGLDIQTANRVLAGPTTGAAAVPTFRTLVAADLPANGEVSLMLANGANNNVAIGTGFLARVTGPTAPFNITGIAGGYAGRELVIYNTVANNMTMTNESASSLAANRIITLSGSSTSGTGVIRLVYSGTDSRWIVTGTWS